MNGSYVQEKIEYSIRTPEFPREGVALDGNIFTTIQCYLYCLQEINVHFYYERDSSFQKKFPLIRQHSSASNIYKHSS